MYQLLGNEVLDSKEIGSFIEEKTDFRLREDMTRGTKREDALGYKLSVSVPLLMEKAPRYIEDEETMTELMNLADERLRKQLEELGLKEVLWQTYAYSYDEVDHEILLVASAMSQENGRRKLPDVIKRLLSEV